MATAITSAGTSKIAAAGGQPERYLWTYSIVPESVAPLSKDDLVALDFRAPFRSNGDLHRHAQDIHADLQRQAP